MDPENPPRRTKPDQEPVTIDLEATRDETGATPHVTAAPDASPQSEDAVSPQDETAYIEAQDEARDDPVGPAGEPRAEEAAGAFAGATSSSQPPHAASPPPPARASRSGALAAGIVGGLIALIGAGVLQYSGLLPALGPAASPSGGRDLGGEIDALKAAAGDSAALAQRLSAVEQSVSGGGAGATALGAEVENLTRELAALKSGLADQQQSTEAATTQLSTRIEEAEKKLDEPASDVQLARAIAVTALKTAIDRGGPFPAELEALRSVSPDDPAVAGLSDIAPRGVASRADLTRDFPAAADAMLAAVRGADPNRGVFSRLMDSAATAIRVRPVGSIEGNGPEAVVARIEDRLTNGDFRGANLEWDALPRAAKDAGAGFKSALDRRLTVEGLIDTAVSGASKPNQG